jgi:peptide subunit release factor 1 (eRF1)
VTVYLGTEADVENAARHSSARWRDLRRDLADRGADEAALREIDPLVADAHRFGACLAAVAAPGELRHVEHGTDGPPTDWGTWDELPALAPLVKWRQSAPPYLLVLTDRRGADILVAGRYEQDPGHDRVEGTEPLRKVNPGGWSQRRYQQRAEDSWETNARVVADAVKHEADAVGAEVVVVGGDERAVSLLEKHLPEHVLQRVEEIAGGRAAGGSRDAIASETHRWVATAAANDTVAALEKFREELGQHDRAVEGVESTLVALSEARVEVLFVHDDNASDRRAWFGTQPVPVAAESQPLLDLGVEGTRSSRLADVAIRAAFGTGAGVRVVPRHGGPADGFGALLRWR